MIFSVARTRFDLEGNTLRTAPGMETNVLRGALGAALRSASAQVYTKWFDPRWPDGPSGYRDAPRPFVLRWGEGAVDLIIFRTNQAEEIEQAVDCAIKQVSGAHIRLERMPMLQLPLDGTDADGDLRLVFATPTELKSKGEILRQP